MPEVSITHNCGDSWNTAAMSSANGTQPQKSLKGDPSGITILPSCVSPNSPSLAKPLYLEAALICSNSQIGTSG